MPNPKCIAIIPARGGSKRIPDKNIKPFLGKPIIGHVIEHALNSKIFDRVMVSTDSQSIAEIAQKFGAEVPFMRSAKNSDDFATTSAVLLEVLDEYKNLGVQFDWFCCIYPVAALISGPILQKAWANVHGSRFDSMMSVVAYGHPIQRALAVSDAGIQFVSPEYRSTRTQDLPRRFHDAGQFYFAKTAEFLRSKSVISENCAPFEISELECQDIDSLVDWRLAELKAQLQAE